MPLFLCRWPNGDCSVVLARTQDDAVVAFDQVGNAEGCPITQLRTFQVHFALTDQGHASARPRMRLPVGLQELRGVDVRVPLRRRQADVAQ